MSEEVLGPDWVEKRAQCSIEKQFEKLHLVVERDTQAMNRVLKDKEEVHIFKSSQVNQGRIFEVTRYKAPNSLPQGKVSFWLKNEMIFVSQDEIILFKVSLEWNDRQTHCDLRIDNEPHELWEISQRALGSFFFGK